MDGGQARRVESPDTVHGRLLEAVHISGYSFERACSELEWLLEEDRWTKIGGGYNDINAFLATIDLSEFKIAIEQRQKLARRLKDIEASQRATAKALGVSPATINSDIRDVQDQTRSSEVVADDCDSLGADVQNQTPEWFQDDVDPAQSAKKQAKQNQKKRERQENNVAARKGATALPEGKYAAIYADPPWTFQVWSGEGKDRAAENHYPTMTQEQIEALPIGDLAADDCALFMWAVWPQLPEALSVIESWGFEYKTCAFVWAKSTKSDIERFATGMGYWTRANSEVCLLATRGAPKRLNADVHQIVSPRQEHSRKPDEVAERIERLVAGPYIELFARRPREGWDVWGNQT